MQKIESANQLSGRATGVIVCAGFGALWLFLSLYARQTLSAVTVSGVVLGMLALILAAVLLFREAKRWPRVPEDPAVGRAFGWINTIQWIAVGAVAFGRLHPVGNHRHCGAAYVSAGADLPLYGALPGGSHPAGLGLGQRLICAGGRSARDYSSGHRPDPLAQRRPHADACLQGRPAIRGDAGVLTR
jgi:hypothetical protein